MPSDAPTAGTDVPEPVLSALRAPQEAFHSALVSTAEEVRGMLQEAEESGDDHADHLAAELGPFATGRIDAGRLATLISKGTTLSPASTRALARAAEVMDGTLGDGAAEPLVVDVPAGEDLRDVVRTALTRTGRAFGAARVADAARSGGFRPDDHEGFFEGLPFRSWTALERLLAPPLVVRVRGDDLRPAGLADFLDGALKIVLVVEGDAPPAALARMITPGVMVVQATSPEELAPLAGYHGPAVAALFRGPAREDGPIAFVHDPRRGVLPWRRIELKADLDTLRGFVSEKRWPQRSWREDVEHLLELATPPSGEADEATGAEVPEPGTGPATGADRLAAWLIARTDLDGA